MSLLLPHRLPGPPVEAVLIERENRFLARCRLANDTIVHAHVPDRGRLLELLVPGVRVWLYSAPAGVRRTSWSLLVAEDPATGNLVAIDPAGANARVQTLLKGGHLPDLGQEWAIQPEVRIGESRIDFLLTRGEERLALEVKSVGVVRNGTALFPDAPTVRGARHLGVLAEFARQPGCRSRVLFVAQRGDATEVRPDAVIDPVFATELRRVAKRVELRAIRLGIKPEGCVYEGPIPVRLD